MRMLKLVAGAGLILIMSLVVWTGVARSQSFQSGNTVTVPVQETVQGMLWAGARNIDIAGTVNGDVFCGGMDINISGTVNGDVLCAGQNVHVSGTVNGDIRLAGQSVSLSGKVTGSGTIAAQTVAIDQSGSVGRDLSVAGTDMTVNGGVARDLAAAAATMTVGSQVGRNVTANVDTLHLSSGAIVDGNLTYTSRNTASIDHGAKVAGVTKRLEPQARPHRTHFFGYALLFGLFWLVAMLIVALVLILLVPRLFKSVTQSAVDRPWHAVLVGLIANLVFPVVFIALLITVLGIPLALLLLLMWSLIVIFGSFFFSFFIGRLILRNRGNVIWMMLLGTLIVTVVGMIPFVGFLVFLASLWWGTGMILMNLSGWFKRPDYSLPA